MYLKASNSKKFGRVYKVLCIYQSVVSEKCVGECAVSYSTSFEAYSTILIYI